ncbi:MAG: hypothetical protein KKA73_10810 [Chloroflexi bacterium]|nr:hypothetical protein [Chloroflexota bacterium]MBU1748168.1 hypothetical protein [Chloroflexota bacterium]
MPVTYTSRKGITYILCRVTTRTGKPRYVFAREPRGEVVEEIPAGFHISESVNGIVSLVRDRPAQIRPAEVAAVEAAVRRHPRARNYRVAVKGQRIEVYERMGPDVGDLMATFEKSGLAWPGLALRSTGVADQLQAEFDRYGQFTPVLRFTLHDADRRTFGAQRMCYRSSIDGWLDLHLSGSVEQLAHRLVPTLGTERFFELY